jgi:hypothetical protein
MATTHWLRTAGKSERAGASELMKLGWLERRTAGFAPTQEVAYSMRPGRKAREAAGLDRPPVHVKHKGALLPGTRSPSSPPDGV